MCPEPALAASETFPLLTFLSWTGDYRGIQPNSAELKAGNALSNSWGASPANTELCSFSLQVLYAKSAAHQFNHWKGFILLGVQDPKSLLLALLNVFGGLTPNPWRADLPVL